MASKHSTGGKLQEQNSTAEEVTENSLVRDTCMFIDENVNLNSLQRYS